MAADGADRPESLVRTGALLVRATFEEGRRTGAAEGGKTPGGGPGPGRAAPDRGGA